MIPQTPTRTTYPVYQNVCILSCKINVIPLNCAQFINNLKTQRK